MRVNFRGFGEDIPVTYDAGVQFGPPAPEAGSTSFWDTVSNALQPVIAAGSQAAASAIYRPRPGQPGYVAPSQPTTAGGMRVGGTAISTNMLILGGVGVLALFLILGRRR